MNEAGLYVSMLGGLYIEFEGKPIQLPLDIHSITVQLLLFLWDAGKKGLSRDAILNRLYGENEVSDPANSMRVNIFRLRKMIKKLGLPENEYIVVDHGFYKWDSGPIKMQTDAEQFADFIRKAGKAASKEEENRLLSEACDFYKGEFLPELAAEQWVAVRSVDYEKMYGKAVYRLHHNYMASKKYGEAAAVAGRALGLYPYEEFAKMEIDALMAQGYFQEAMEILDKIGRQMFQSLGVAPSADLMKRYEELSNHIGISYTAIKKIKTQLSEDAIHGAYYCSFPSFVDCYRVLSRISIRSGQPLFLINCVLADNRGKMLENGDRASSLSSFVMKAIEESLRSGDIYTKSNDNQYLILLSGLTLENCSLVTERIGQSFHKTGAARGLRLDFHITAAFSEKKK